MEAPFVDFRPAEYHDCKSGGYVCYYVLNPADKKMHRKQIRLGKIHSKSERRKYALHLCHVINSKLYSGWNPYKNMGSIKGVSMQEAIAMFIAEKNKYSREATMVSYRSLSNIFLKWLTDNGFELMDTNDMTEKMLIDYMDYVDRVRKPTNRTFNNYTVFLNTMFDFFMERKLMDTNPMPKFKKRKVDGKKRTIIPPDVRKRIKEYYLERMPSFYIVMLLCYKCFIRPKEIVNLKIGDIGWADHTITVNSKIAKNHNERRIMLPDEIMEYFLKLVKFPSSWFIFTGRNKFLPGKKSMPHTRISECWSVMRDDLRLLDCYQFYGLKDTGITEMLEAGVPSKYVKELADHSSLEITEKYIHKSDLRAVTNCEMLNF